MVAVLVLRAADNRRIPVVFPPLDYDVYSCDLCVPTSHPGGDNRAHCSGPQRCTLVYDYRLYDIKYTICSSAS